MKRLGETDPLYQLYLPLTYNDGSPIEEGKFNMTRQELVTRFGGLTTTPPGFPLQGWWQSAGAVVRDDIVVWTVVTQGDENGFFQTFKQLLRERFAQEEIYIVKIPAEAL
ncbi:hypothetical protein ES703_68662 [subsurface metagenome]